MGNCVSRWAVGSLALSGSFPCPFPRTLFPQDPASDVSTCRRLAATGASALRTRRYHPHLYLSLSTKVHKRNWVRAGETARTVGKTFISLLKLSHNFYVFCSYKRVKVQISSKFILHNWPISTLDILIYRLVQRTSLEYYFNILKLIEF